MSLLVHGSDYANATITQVDGTILPATGLLQTVFDGIPEPIDAVLDASELPEVFLPNTVGVVVFTDISEFAGFENSFGWYNVGDDVTTAAGRARNLHPVLGCGVPMVDAVGAEDPATMTDAVLLASPHVDHHHGDTAHYFTDADDGDSASVDFGQEQTDGRYKGGFIAFYLITPQGNPSSNNCGDFKDGTDGNSLFGFIYYTQKDLNDDGDFVHHLVYTAASAADRFYFAFEDLFRGGDNDFTDMTIQVTGLTPPCVPQAEICDGIDNDCDGDIDAADPDLSDVDLPCVCDGVGITCQGGARDGECQTGVTVCAAATIECQSTVSPVGELCNGLDDNCDGAVDDNPAGVGGACDGPDSDLCDEGVFVCSGGVIGCDDTTGPNDEFCNNTDDDCDGITDELPVDVGGACDGADADLCVEGVFQCVGGVPTCDDTTGTTVEVCNGVDEDCDGTTDEDSVDVGGSCSAGIGACAASGAIVCSGGTPTCNATPGAPGTESCNGIDDDCDVAIDESFGVGLPCDGVGECGPGLLECDGPAGIRCSTDPGGSGDESVPETCNGLDDDCDTFVDEGLTDLGPCGSSTGVCSEGVFQCIGGGPVCVGGVSPTPELCDTLDNDCNGLVDDSPVDAGASCGSGVGECTPGTIICSGGSLSCDGAVGGGPELCDGLDNDCNAIADDSPIDVGLDCGVTDEGECSFGTSVCVLGTIQCVGEVGPVPETCDTLDNDCDTAIDEDPVDVGTPCGIATGVCTPGTLICTATGPECVGETTGTLELCNGIDDDCDGVIDDDPAGVDVPCGMGEGVCELGELKCINGALECVGGFDGTTETCNGLDDDCDGEIDEGDLCDGGVCGDGVCSAPCEPGEFGCPVGEICVDGFCLDDPCFGLVCPDDMDGEQNVCVDGVCVPICDTIDCPDELICRDTDGLCVPNNCNFLPLCGEDELCIDEACTSDPCAGVDCPSAQFCREGACIDSCGGIECEVGAVCHDGMCAPTGCAEDCAEDEVCNAATGECEPSPCQGVSCPIGEVCDPSTGDCIIDPCIGIECPEGEICHLGDCYDFVPGTEPDAGVKEHIVAAGGGACEIGRGSAGWGAGLLALFGFVLLRRRRRTDARALVLLIAVGALAMGGAACNVDPFCLNCADDDDTGGDDAAIEDAGIDATPDGGPGCDAGVVQQELCDGVDNDCDGEIDEDFDFSDDFFHCGACGISCEKDGTQTHCEDAVCVMDGCFPGNVDLNGDLGDPFDTSDGCEYACFESNGTVEACDTLDNDCDGSVDEDTDLDGDESNCGECGRVCNLFHATTTCVTGVCSFDPATDCDAGFFDIDGLQDNGCEYACSATGAEVCNLVDDDCNGLIDETFDLMTDPLNCNQCDLVCAFPNATASCAAGVCTFDPMTDCDAGFVDADGLLINGCEYPCVPTGAEVCDLQDNDCNGIVDDSPGDAGGSCNNAPGGVATGACTETGVEICSLGSLVCSGAPEPSPEICNGIDDDCDGPIDDNPVDAGALCSSPVGICSAGILTCTAAGVIDCIQSIGPSAEVCNGLDDDCNTFVDDSPTDPELGMSCGTDTGVCVAGIFACVGDRVICMGSTGPTLETCNGLDDDCDGPVDNSVIDAGGSCGLSVGACVPGTEVCVSPGVLSCSGGIGPTGETCNSTDDDCDSTVDEKPGGGPLELACYTGPGGTEGVGLCTGGTRFCSAGVFGACTGEVTPVAETCDNQDEDCDTFIDNGVTRSCYTGAGGTEGVGLCAAGIETCSLGSFGSCVGDVTPGSEICDNLDQDCDGAVDELPGGGPLTQSCYSGPGGTEGNGTCVGGTETCSFGSFGVCVGEVTPVLDFCGDGTDTDCDGLDDSAEGCFGIDPGEVRIDAPGGGLGTSAGGDHSFEVQVATGGSPVGRNVYMVWSALNGSGTSQILFRRSTDGGASFGTILNLSSGVSDPSVKPVINVGRNAGEDQVYVAFQSVSGGVRSMEFTRSTNSGAGFTLMSQLDSGDDLFHHDIGVSDDGQRVVVVWEELDTGTLDRNVRSRASTNAGASFSAVRTINVNSGGSPIAGRPQAVVTSTGRFVFVWREIRSGNTPDTFATFTDSASAAIPGGNESRLDSDAGDTRQSDFPQLGVNGQNLFIVWQDISTLPGGGSDIVFVRSIDNAASFGAEQILDDPAVEVSSSFTPVMAVDPRTVLMSDDRVFIAWEDRREGTQIYAAVSGDSGASFAPAQRVSSDSGAPINGVTRRPAIAYLGSDSVAVAYTNDPGAGVEQAYVASSIDGGDTWQLTHDRLDTGSGEATLPVIGRIDGGGLVVGAIVSWIDFRTAPGINGDPYSRRVGR